MPEESFEQQARNMAEQFSMEPQPIVWQRVEAAIAPKRKRRAAFVWWLLPLFVAVSLSFWLMKDKKTLLQNKTVTRQTAIVKRNITEQNKVVNDNKKWRQKSSKNKDAITKKYVPVSAKTKAVFVIENKDLKAKKSGAKNENEVTQIQPKTELFANKNVVKENGFKSEKFIASIQPQTNFLADKNAIADSLKIVLQNDVKTNVDTAKANATIATKANDSLKQNKNSSAVAGSKRKTKNKWQMGIIAELGATSLGNGLFGFQSTSSNYLASNPSSISGTDTTTSIYQHKKNGVDATLGVSMYKTVSKRFFFDAQLIYRYQQFSIQTTTLSSLPTALNGNISKSGVDYRFHFANLYTGIGFSLFHKKNTSVALQAGIDNGWLLSVKQKQNDSLQSLTAKGFQRWQPSFQFAVPVCIHASNNVRWQLSPFIRWSLRGLQNVSGSFQHHKLNSAGIQATYFFK